MVYKMFFLGHNFASRFLCTLKIKNLKKSSKNLGWSSPGITALTSAEDQKNETLQTSQSRFVDQTEIHSVVRCVPECHRGTLDKWNVQSLSCEH